MFTMSTLKYALCFIVVFFFIGIFSLSLYIFDAQHTDATTVERQGNLREIHVSDDPGDLEDKEFNMIHLFTPDYPQGVTCIVWKDLRGNGFSDDEASRYAYSGLSCDWKNS